MPSQTNYVVRTLKTVPYTHAHAAPLLLLAQVLSLGYLHKEVREKGGAYGGGATANALGGTFSFSSYRDPRQLETLAAFDAAAAWAAAEGSVTAQHVEEAQLQCFKGLDAPRAPSARGWGRFAQPQLTDDARQAFRERLLDTTPADLRAVAAQYLAAPPTPAAECIVGNAAAVGVDAGDGWAVLGPDLQPLGKGAESD